MPIWYLPFDVYMPMLHGMRHIRRLNNVLDDDGCLSIDLIQLRAIVVPRSVDVECLRPSILS